MKKIQKMTLEEAKKAALRLEIGDILEVEITDADLLNNKKLLNQICFDLNDTGRRDSAMLISNHGPITMFNRQ